MAKGKKSIVVYSDWKENFESLSDEEAGRLIKHFFRYVNDENPVPEDRITEISFIPLKNALKRDLDKWETEIEKRSVSGRLGNLKRWNLDLFKKVEAELLTLEKAEEIANHRKLSHTDEKDTVATKKVANIAVNVNDSVIVNDILLKKETKINIVDRKLKFSDTLKPFLDIYGKDLLNDFFKYWTEPNKSGTKFRQELEKTWDVSRRLETWSKNDKNFTNGKPANTTATAKPKFRKVFSNLANQHEQAETGNIEGELFEDTEYTEVE